MRTEQPLLPPLPLTNNPRRTGKQEGPRIRTAVRTSSALPALSQDLTAVLKLTVVGKSPAFLMSPSSRSVLVASPFRAQAARARLKLSRSGWCLFQIKQGVRFTVHTKPYGVYEAQ